MFPLGTQLQYNTVQHSDTCSREQAVCDAQTGLQRVEETTGQVLNDYTVNIALGSFGVCRDTKSTKLLFAMERRRRMQLSSTLELLPGSAHREVLDSGSPVALLVGISPQKSQFFLQGT